MASQSGKRLFSLDVFRGITIAGMILVDCPGGSVVHPLLRHAPWNGWTLADLVFPSFLVIMGISLVISLSRRLAREERFPRLSLQILRRTVIIFAFGLLISFFIFNPPIGLRIPGVLQRIAVCYLFCSIVYLSIGPVLQALLCAALLIGYWFLLAHVRVPGYGAPDFTQAGNIACYVDRAVLGAHMWAGALCDPEGILSTLGAAATALLGVLSGEWLMASRAKNREAKVMELAAAGAILMAAGLFWGRYLPINKHIWTSSYVLFTGGLAMAGFALCYWLVEILGFKAWGKPFEIFGRNPLLAYFLSGFFYALQQYIHPLWAGGLSLNDWLCARLFGWWLSPVNASLLYALAYLLVCLIGMRELYRRNIFLKI